MELLKVESLVKQYRIRRHWWNKPEVIAAVYDVSFAIKQGESFGLVGESGCGKSTLAQLVALLEPPTSGKVFFHGAEVTGLGYEEQRWFRQKLQIVFQDAGLSLNPRFTVDETLREPLINFGLAELSEWQGRVRDTAEALEISERLLHRFPHELSGGEKQRVSIARALILKPEFVIFDEVTTGLDVTLQYHILQLLQRLRSEFGLTYLFITHDLRLIPLLTGSVGIMHAGRIVEFMASENISQAKHPYTQELLNAVPVRHPRQRKRVVTVS
jgi:ABC-type oligopeptide transport system ATPase subunit